MEDILQQLENFCQKQNIPHRFVGGVSFGGLLNKQTLWQIDIKNKIIILKKYNMLCILRDDNTIKDIDLILITTSLLQKNILNKFIDKIKKNYSQFPSITIELIKNKSKHNISLQFVTTLVEEKNDLYFIFDTITEKLSKDSLEPWNLILEDGLSITVRNPIADYYAYQFRSPSGVKEKDKGKLVLLKKLANDVIRLGLQDNIDFMSDKYYGTWKKYTEKLQTTNNMITIIKKYMMSIYWKTIGTYLAHESGLFSFLSDKFTG